MSHSSDVTRHGNSLSTYKGYVIGFILAVILTIIPFWLVMGEVFTSIDLTVIAIMGLGAVQVIVHMVYFLHMNRKSEGGWTLMALLFTIMILVIAISGSMWVMYNLNTNMMPSMMIHEIK
ncbi:MAG: cytochrome o ubiquinol oxidase subunit IV [Rhizobiales bacterium]|nr:cytochrome o ubiquinol oxidase subunit IV [Hyphomicrobiales bacterium]